MKQEHTGLQDRRGLRFPFDAGAEVVFDSPANTIRARVTELSFRGCFLEISTSLKQQKRVHVKILHSNKYFEASAEVIYVRPTGVGVVFSDIKPHFRSVLQAWILSALDNQAKSEHPDGTH